MRARGELIRADRRPMHLTMEQYVRCPRAGMVSVERCFGCDLLQGTLSGDHPEILCAWSEREPALRRHIAVGPGRDRDRAETVCRTDGPIFESDWPEE